MKIPASKKRELIYWSALIRIAQQETCVSYEYDSAPTEREIALKALDEASKVRGE